MARNLKIGDTVFIPYSKIDPKFLERPRPFFETAISMTEGRSVRIALPDGEESDLIGTSIIHRNIGTLIIQIGDFISENILLNPLSKTILQFCRLLLGDDSFVYFEKCRTVTEFRYIWLNHSDSYKYIILIGHGTKDSLIFGMDVQINSYIIRDIISNSESPKSIISLCCKTGQSGFAGVVSQSDKVESLIAPFHSIHGVIASQFIQTYLTNHLLGGMIDKAAFNKASESIIGNTKFRFWENGRLQ